jgi:hypothetical protein
VSRIGDVFPGVETAVQLEPEELGVPLLEYLCGMEEGRGSSPPHLGNFLISESLRDYAGSRYDEFIKVATEAWMWLLHEGLIAPHPTQRGDWVFVTRRGKEFRRVGDPGKFRAANLLPQDTLDPAIASKVRPPFLRGDYDSAVFEAFKEVEIRVRGLSRLTKDDIGVSRLTLLLQNNFHVNPVVIRSEAGMSRPLIDKYEDNASVCAFALTLVTPDDEISSSSGRYHQARPNVIFELGWFVGRLGKHRVAILLKEGTTIHSDLDGVSRVQFRDSVEEKYLEIQRELAVAGVI